MKQKWPTASSAARFDVTENLKKFAFFLETKQSLNIDLDTDKSELFKFGLEYGQKISIPFLSLLAPERFTRSLMARHADAWQVFGRATLERSSAPNNTEMLSVSPAPSFSLLQRWYSNAEVSDKLRRHVKAASPNADAA